MQGAAQFGQAVTPALFLIQARLKVRFNSTVVAVTTIHCQERSMAAGARPSAHWCKTLPASNRNPATVCGKNYSYR